MIEPVTPADCDTIKLASIVWSPVNKFEPVVANEPVSIVVPPNEPVDTACGTPLISPTHAYPSSRFGKSLLLPLPCITISPSVPSTLPTTPMFCISAVPVGLVCVKLPVPTYMF